MCNHSRSHGKLSIDLQNRLAQLKKSGGRSPIKELAPHLKNQLMSFRCSGIVADETQARQLQGKIVSELLRTRETKVPTNNWQPFWVSPVSIKHPHDNFNLRNVNWRPPKCKLAPSKLRIGDLQSAVFVSSYTEITPSQFTFWRVSICTLEAEIVLGVLYRKGETPKKVGTLGFPHQNSWNKTSQILAQISPTALFPLQNKGL